MKLIHLKTLLFQFSMLYRNTILTYCFFIFSGIQGQTILNGFGIGYIQPRIDAASIGISSTGLLPAFQSGVSLNNPVTWHDLHFAYISTMYGGNQVNQSEDDIINGHSALTQFQFILPIKKKYIFGIGISPYASQYYNLTGIDTLANAKTLEGSGGINSLHVSFGQSSGRKENFALAFDFLFGSSRMETILTLDQTDYIYNQRNLFSGILAKLYVESSRIHFYQTPVHTYFAIQGSVKPLSVRSFSYQPVVRYGFNQVFPNPNKTPDPVQSHVTNVILPFEFQLGFDIELKEKVHILGEGTYWKDGTNKQTNFSILRHKVVSTERISFGIIRFAKNYSRSIMDFVHFRSGIFALRSVFDSRKNVDERGVSFGIGIKFGVTNNQIDFGYSIIQRSGFNVDGEIIQKFRIGLSLGDIWFIKRRER